MVELREVRPADLPVLFEHQRDPVAVAMADFPAREREAFDAHWARLLADDTCVTQAVVVDGEVVGNIGCWDGEGGREVGYWIGREHWGKGLASEALRLLLELESHRPLHAHTATTNVISQRVLAKHGFEVVASGPDGLDHVLRAATSSG